MKVPNYYEKNFFVSTGRCGTKKIYELLSNRSSNISAVHQLPESRLGNVLGNIMFFFYESEKIKTLFYNKILKYCPSHKQTFICSDPLTAMLLPNSAIKDPDVMVVLIVREKETFATSLFKLSRKRAKSFIAHNFIPFWQPSLWPFENLLSKNILKKYRHIWKIKNCFFRKKYSKNKNFIEVSMEEVFNSDFLEKRVNNFCKENIKISKQELTKKSNQ